MSHHRHPLNLIFILAISLFSAQALAGISVGSYIGKYCQQDCVQPLVLAKAVLRNAKALKLNPRLILAVIKTESKFRISAKNGSSRGLMQVHLRYHQSKFQSSNAYDVDDNVRVGSIILNDCVKRYKVRDKALTCYNGGGDPNYAEKALKNYAEAESVDLPTLESLENFTEQQIIQAEQLGLVDEPSKVCESDPPVKKPKIVTAAAVKHIATGRRKS